MDVTLLCDGGSYPAHRLVLAACSPYFHQLFTRLPTQHPLIYLRDVKQAELEALLEFIYRGEVSVSTVYPQTNWISFMYFCCPLYLSNV